MGTDDLEGYTPLFDWKAAEESRGARIDGAPSYLYDEPLELAINVALAARRPLLLSGLPGTGKSTLAADVAWKLGRRYYSQVVTSRTHAQELQWTVDAVGRLSAAEQRKDVHDQRPFVKPGVLWRAFDTATAAMHGESPPKRLWQDQGEHAVVLLDEIDKAEPDVPNDLLAILDRREFFVGETNTPVKLPEALDVLVVITTNGERDLPPAFLRRCVCYEIRLPDDAPTRDRRLAEIARRHFSTRVVSDALLASVIALYGTLRSDAASKKLREPSTAELIDALRACDGLGIRDVVEPDKPSRWQAIVTAAMWKHPSKQPASGDRAGAGAPSARGAVPAGGGGAT